MSFVWIQQLLKNIFRPVVRPLFSRLRLIIREEITNGLSFQTASTHLRPPSTIEITERPLFPKIIKTFYEWDNFVDKANHLEATDSKKFHQHLQAHTWDIQAFIDQFEQQGGKIRKKSPLSEMDYFKKEKEFFEFLSGKPYDFKHEGHHLDVDSVMKNYPLSCYRNYIDYNWNGFSLLNYIQPRIGGRFLDLGYGWGNLLELFGRAGCSVSGVDASPSFQELALRRCTMQNIKIDLLTHGPFSLVCDFQSQYDYIAFDSAFHHCETPVDILSLLRKKVSSDGRLIFINEPIVDWFERPWGFVRSDGETALQIRKRAWFEIGIRTDFFNELLEVTGWRLLDTTSHQFIHPTFIAQPI